jgi:cytochrome c
MRYQLFTGLAFASLFVSGAPASGEVDYAIAFNSHCRTCHSIRSGDHRLGPSLAGIFEAQAGASAGYIGYSGALAGLKWTEETLDAFIADPASIASNTNMIYPPVADAAVRKNIIAFLKSISLQ